MVAVAHRDADKFVGGAVGAYDIFLVFGSDVGLVAERSSSILKQCGIDPSNADQLTRLDGDEIASNPGLLFEEAHGMGLFASRRAIIVKAGGKQFQSSIETLLQEPAQDCKIIIQAGTLRRDAPLRVLATRAKNAAAIECYADNEKDLERLIETEARKNGLAISPDARSALVSLLGDDRLSTRNELEKLALYCQGKTQVTGEDIIAAVADASAFAMDSVISAAFSGDFGFLGDDGARLYTTSNEIPALLAGASRHAHMLFQMRIDLEKGASLDGVMERYAGRAIFGARRDALQRQAATWRRAALVDVIASLNQATLESRIQSDLAVAITMDALLLIARRFRALSAARSR